MGYLARALLIYMEEPTTFVDPQAGLVPRAILVYQGLLVNLDSLDLQERLSILEVIPPHLGHLDFQVYQVEMACLGDREILVREATQAPQDRKELWVRPTKDRRVSQDVMGILVDLDPRAPQGLLVWLP
jgi:hypothetical protein